MTPEEIIKIYEEKRGSNTAFLRNFIRSSRVYGLRLDSYFFDNSEEKIQSIIKLLVEALIPTASFPPNYDLKKLAGSKLIKDAEIILEYMPAGYGLISFSELKNFCAVPMFDYDNKRKSEGSSDETV